MKLLFVVFSPLFFSLSLAAQAADKTLPEQPLKQPGVVPKNQQLAPLRAPVGTATSPSTSSAAASNDRVMDGPINTRAYQRFGGNRPAWEDLELAVQQLQQSIDNYQVAAQALTAKVRECFPPADTLSVDQQRQAGCRRGETVEQCYTKYIDMCTRREKANSDAAASVLYQDGKRVKDMLQSNTRFR